MRPVIETSGGASSRPAKALFGTAAVALILGASRWGSTIGANPLYLTDALLGLAVIGYVLNRPRHRAEPASVALPSPLLAAFFAYVALRAIWSYGMAPGLELVRDAVPYLYAVIGFFSAAAYARSTAKTRERTMRILWWAITFHVVWMLLIVRTGRSTVGLGPSIGGTPLFQVRPDIDSALLAIAVGMYFRQIILGANRTWCIIGIAASIAAVTGLASRAGLVSFAFTLALAFILGFAASGKKPGRRVAMLLAIPVALLAIWVTLPLSTPGQRILATINPASASSAEQQSAIGTQRARETTWSMIIDWTNETPSRAVVGSGFGNNFLEQSGTLDLLQGTTYSGVRSPHNWFVGTYARLGLIGVALAIAVCVQLIATIGRQRRRIGEDPLLSLAALIIVAILPVAFLGVVLEAPFGAVPFWWAAGVILAARTHKAGSDDRVRSRQARGEIRSRPAARYAN